MQCSIVDMAEPTRPGWYGYDGGAGVMVFRLRVADHGLQWSAHGDNGVVVDCVWEYISQALSVWGLQPIERPAWA